jgi:hypothetical protein
MRYTAQNATATALLNKVIFIVVYVNDRVDERLTHAAEVHSKNCSNRLAIYIWSVVVIFIGAAGDGPFGIGCAVATHCSPKDSIKYIFRSAINFAEVDRGGN